MYRKPLTFFFPSEVVEMDAKAVSDTSKNNRLHSFGHVETRFLVTASRICGTRRGGGKQKYIEPLTVLHGYTKLRAVHSKPTGSGNVVRNPIGRP